MPSRPPALQSRPSRVAWQPSAGRRDQRRRGRAGVREREAIRREEPLCRECLRNGLVTPTTEVDHIVPLSGGGRDVRSNKQGLCTPCHEVKSKAERAAAARGARPA